jgi:hypothetical protein
MMWAPNFDNTRDGGCNTMFKNDDLCQLHFISNIYSNEFVKYFFSYAIICLVANCFS